MLRKVVSGELVDSLVHLFILFGFVLLLIAGSPVMAATYSVCPSGCNFTSIQAAINAASDGDTIEIRGGHYIEPLIVDRRLVLKGVASGGGYPVIDAGGAEFGITLKAPGIQISSLNITGANSSAILIESDNNTLHDLIIVHPKVTTYYLTYPAVTGEDLTGLEISACKFYVRGDTVVLHDPHDYSITGNTFLNPLGYSVAIVSSGSANPTENGVISGNTITQSRGAGIGIIAKSAGGLVRNLTVSDNCVSGSGGSIGLFIPSENVIIRNNTLQENPGTPRKGIYGIMLYGTSGVLIEDNHVVGTNVELAYRFEDCSRLTITGNTVDSNSDTGMGCLWITNSTLSRNTMDKNVYNFWMSPFVLDSGVLPGNKIDKTNLVDGKPVLYFEGVDDLSIGSPDTPGMVILYACDNADIRDLTCTANSAGLMAIRSENLTVTNCSFDQMYCGILTVASPHLTIRENHLTDCFDGLMIGNFYGGLVSDNLVENSADCGIVTGIYLEDVAIRNNTIDGSIAGIYLDRVSGYNNAVFSGNIIRNTAVAGFSTDQAEGAILSDNTLEPVSGLGFDISGGSSLNITGNTLAGDAINGILLFDSQENTITSNNLSASENGIILQRRQGDEGSHDNLIADNFITSEKSVLFCIRGGLGEDARPPKFISLPVTPVSGIPKIILALEEDSTGPEDFFCSPDTSPPANAWNFTKTIGTNIVNGPYLGGNYWADPDGAGWSQVTPDRGDGFCNSPYAFNSKNTDCLPLHLFEGEIPITAPAMIDQPGNYRLMNDLSNSTTETAILIKASDVIVNGNGHTLAGVGSENTNGVLGGGTDEYTHNITIRNLTLSGWEDGILFEKVSGGILQGNTLTGNARGVEFISTNGCLVTENNASGQVMIGPMNGAGLVISRSSNNTFSHNILNRNGLGASSEFGGQGILAVDMCTDNLFIGNTIQENQARGIEFGFSCGKNMISNNSIHRNGDGIALLGHCDGNDLSGNLITENTYGILIDGSENNRLRLNSMAGNTFNFLVAGLGLENYIQDIDPSNTVDGKAILYFIDVTGREIGPDDNPGSIYAIGGGNLSLRDLNLSRNGNGAFFWSSSNVLIDNVTCNKNSRGIVFEGNADSITLYQVHADQNGGQGISIRGARDISIQDCNASFNWITGIDLEGCNNIVITNTSASHNVGEGLADRAGIVIFDSQNVSLEMTRTSYNRDFGIFTGKTRGMVIRDGITDCNGRLGIVILDGSDAEITGMRISENEDAGIGMKNLSSGLIFNNYLNNTRNTDIEDQETSTISWNTAKTSGPNIVNGPYIGGNYWADPDGTGWSQVTPDRGDGFCNSPFVISRENTDSLPLHIRAEPPFYADFIADPLSGTTPLTVQFSDQSNGNISRWFYQFGDGFSSINKNPVHTYKMPGNYTVRLMILARDGMSIQWMTMVREAYIQAKSPVNPDVSIDFTAEPVSGPAPLRVQFTGNTTGPPGVWKYDFGDRSSSTQKDPAHVYAKPGTYTVNLTVWSFTPGKKLVTSTLQRKNYITVT